MAGGAGFSRDIGASWGLEQGATAIGLLLDLRKALTLLCRHPLPPGGTSRISSVEADNPSGRIKPVPLCLVREPIVRRRYATRAADSFDRSMSFEGVDQLLPAKFFM